MSSSGAPAPERLHTIDALRGLAALTVAWYHLTYGTSTYLADGPFKATGHYGGVAGVQAFFVISGFIIPYALHRARYTYRSFFRFVGKRMLRLDPPYLASIVLVLAIAGIAHGFPALQLPIPPIRLPQLLAHLGYANAVLGYPWLNNVYWTLGIELQYYLLIALLFPAWQRLPERSRWLVPLLLAIAAFLPHPDWLYDPTHNNLILQFLGVFGIGFLAFLHRTGMLHWRRYLALLVVVACLVYTRLDAVTACTATATALAISFVTLRHRLLSWLGEFSYSFYLVHEPVRWVFYGIAVLLGLGQTQRELMAFATLAVALLLARGMYVLVERPAQRLSSRVRYARVDRPAPAAELAAGVAAAPTAAGA